jgi:hypothetical protein
VALNDRKMMMCMRERRQSKPFSVFKTCPAKGPSMQDYPLLFLRPTLEAAANRGLALLSQN